MVPLPSHDRCSEVNLIVETKDGTKLALASVSVPLGYQTSGVRVGFTDKGCGWRVDYTLVVNTALTAEALDDLFQSLIESPGSE